MPTALGSKMQASESLLHCLLKQGAGVTNTIRSNIANLSYYTNKPDLYM